MERTEPDIASIPARTKKEAAVSFRPFGEPVTAEEVSERLSHNLYVQLSDNNDKNTEKAIDRSQVYCASILKRLSVEFNVNEPVIREIVLINAIYEMHIALGHEDAGKEYRMRAKDIILAAYGDYPDTDDKSPAKNPVASVAKPERPGRTWKY